MGDGCDSLCYEPSKNLEQVKTETTDRLQKFIDRRFNVPAGLQTLELLLNDFLAGHYIRKLDGRKGNDGEYVHMVEDFSFQLNVAYGL